MNQPMRMAVIGVGHFGRVHAGKVSQTDGAELVAVADVDAGRAAEVAGELGVAAVSDLAELYDKVDAVCVAVATRAHAEVAGAFLERGIHVLVEKPITPDVESARALIDTAAKNNVILQVGHLQRFFGVTEELRKRVSRPLFIECVRIAPFKQRGTDVNVILDLMIHDLQILHALDRSPLAEVRATGIEVLSGRVDIANARVVFESGAVANLTASRVSSERVRKLRAFSPSRYYSLDYREQEIKGYRLERESPQAGDGAAAGRRIVPDDLPVERQEPLRAELAAFAAACLGEAPALVDGVEGRRALATALAVTEEIAAGLGDTR